ncbi:MAG: hypothetical protein ACAH95_10310 [Fimbriimonas sp.]
MLREGEVATQWNINHRYIPGVDRAAQYRLTIDYKFDARTTVGWEANGYNQLLPRMTWFVTPEAQSMPSVVLGITGDRLSTPTGQALFLTFSKRFGPVTPFAGIKYGLDEQAVAFPFGVNISYGDNMFQAINDGRHTHLIVTHSAANGFNFSFILARMRYPGIGLSYGF